MGLQQEDCGGSDWSVGAFAPDYGLLASRKEFEVGARRVPVVEPGLSRWAGELTGLAAIPLTCTALHPKQGSRPHLRRPCTVAELDRHWIWGLVNRFLSSKWDTRSSMTMQTSADWPASGRLQRAEFGNPRFGPRP